MLTATHNLSHHFCELVGPEALLDYRRTTDTIFDTAACIKGEDANEKLYHELVLLQAESLGRFVPLLETRTKGLEEFIKDTTTLVSGNTFPCLNVDGTAMKFLLMDVGAFFSWNQACELRYLHERIANLTEIWKNEVCDGAGSLKSTAFALSRRLRAADQTRTGQLGRLGVALWDLTLGDGSCEKRFLPGKLYHLMHYEVCQVYGLLEDYRVSHRSSLFPCTLPNSSYAGQDFQRRYCFEIEDPLLIRFSFSGMRAMHA